MASFKEILSKKTAKDGGDLFGIICSAVDKSGKAVVEEAAGRQSWTSEESISLDNTLWVYSCTKLLTTISILQCVERGQIALDDEVGKVLPELRDPKKFSKEEGAGPQTLIPASRQITLRHLLTHSSGLGYDGMAPDLLAWRASKGQKPMTFSGKVLETHSVPLLFDPGEGFTYGGGLDWVGLLVERLNGGVRLGDYFEKYIFKPLDMKDSTFQLSKRPDLRERLLQMSLRTPNGLVACPAELSFHLPHAPEEDSGGMGLISTVPDLMKVLHDLLLDSPKLLDRKTVDSMFTPQFQPKGPEHKSLIGDNAKLLQSMALMSEPFGSDTPLNYGIGGLLIQEDTEDFFADTMIWSAMPNMTWVVNRRKGVAGLFASQLFPPADGNTATLARLFFKEVWNRSHSK